GRRVDESPQGIARKRMVVAAGIDVFKFTGFVVAALGVWPLEEKALNLVGGVEGVAFLFMKIVGVTLQSTANIGGIRRAIFVYDVAEDQDFARTENIGG